MGLDNNVGGRSRFFQIEDLQVLYALNFIVSFATPLSSLVILSAHCPSLESCPFHLEMPIAAGRGDRLPAPKTPFVGARLISSYPWPQGVQCPLGTGRDHHHSQRTCRVADEAKRGTHNAKPSPHQSLHNTLASFGDRRQLLQRRGSSSVTHHVATSGPPAIAHHPKRD